MPDCSGFYSVRLLLDETGNTVAEYTYDAFGLLLSANGSVDNNYGYHMEYRDETTGLIYLRARWYNPRTGRFLSMDTYEGQSEQPATLHKYVAFGDNGVNLIDLSGHIGMIFVAATYYVAGIMSYYPITYDDKRGEVLRSVLFKRLNYNGKNEEWGHWWVEVDHNESYGWWPKESLFKWTDYIVGVEGELNASSRYSETEIRLKDPHHGDVADIYFYPILKRNSKYKSEKAVVEGIRDFALTYSGKWRFYSRNCHTFQKEMMQKMGLKKGAKQ